MAIGYYVRMTTLKPKLIERDGQWFAMVPLSDFEKLMMGVSGDYLEVKSKKLPDSLYKEIKSGQNAIRVFRKYRGLTQVELAEKAGIARPYLTELETGKKQGSIAVLKAIASALELELPDIA